MTRPSRATSRPERAFMCIIKRPWDSTFPGRPAWISSARTGQPQVSPGSEGGEEATEWRARTPQPPEIAFPGIQRLILASELHHWLIAPFHSHLLSVKHNIDLISFFSPLTIPSVTLSVPLLRPPRCFPVNLPLKTWMQCQSSFLKPASVPGPNFVRCMAWMCPTPPWTAAAASYPGGKLLHCTYVSFTLMNDLIDSLLCLFLTSLHDLLCPEKLVR